MLDVKQEKNIVKGRKQLLAFDLVYGFIAHTSLARNTYLFEVLTTPAAGPFEHDSLWCCAPRMLIAPPLSVANALHSH